MQHDALAAALLTLLSGGEGIPIHLRVTPSDEVQQLRARVADLENQLLQSKRDLQHNLFMRGCEMQVADQLRDLLREHKIPIPRSITNFYDKKDGDADWI